MDWNNYYEITQDNPPSPLLIKALGYTEARESALDLGAGALKDSKFLLAQGFKKVTAVDRESIPENILSAIKDDRFEFIRKSFTEYNFPEAAFDLVSSQYALPFLALPDLTVVFNRIKHSLRKRAIFTGQLFGLHDEWNVANRTMSFLARDDILKLLMGMDILLLKETEMNGRTANGQPKHWHLFDIVARKQ